VDCKISILKQCHLDTVFPQIICKVISPILQAACLWNFISYESAKDGVCTKNINYLLETRPAWRQNPFQYWMIDWVCFLYNKIGPNFWKDISLSIYFVLDGVFFHWKINQDKLGWAEPHSRFPLSIPLISSSHKLKF
jgi:hypothetical protein